MMGRLNHNQGRLFYSFHLDEVVPNDHLVREIAAHRLRLLRLTEVRTGSLMANGGQMPLPGESH
jgi:hypothetical protein